MTGLVEHLSQQFFGVRFGFVCPAVERRAVRVGRVAVDDEVPVVVDGHTTDSHGTALDRGANEAEPHAEELLREVLDEARHLHVSERSIRILESLRTQSVEQLAQHYGVSCRTVREWRRDALNELRERMLSAA